MNKKIAAFLSIALCAVSLQSHALFRDSLIGYTTSYVDSASVVQTISFDISWNDVDGAGGRIEGDEWLEYKTSAGAIIYDAEGGATPDTTNGGASFTADGDIASGWDDTGNGLVGPDTEVGCTKDTDTQCGQRPSAYFYYHDNQIGGANDGDNEDLYDDVIFFRLRVNGDPRNGTDPGFNSAHWNFLVDIDEDNVKEFWIDLEGGGVLSAKVGRVNVIYENNDDDTVTNVGGAGVISGNSQNATCTPHTLIGTDPDGLPILPDGAGTVVNSFVACNYENLGGLCDDPLIPGNDRSFARAVQIDGGATPETTSTGAGPAGNTEWFVDVVVPVAALTLNDGCYTNPDKLTDSEEIGVGTSSATFSLGAGSSARLRYSTSDSNTDPLQKDTVDQDFISTQISTLPVTVAYFQAKRQGDNLNVEWSTATETSNVGFNIYGIINADWIKLNDSPIASTGGLVSLEPVDYTAQVPLNTQSFDAFGIAGVDLESKEDRHGPYPLNTAVGSRPVASPINWGKVRSEMKKSMSKRKVRPGLAVHMDVPADGLYRVTDTELQAIGFNLKGVSAKHIAVSFRGEAVARNIGGLDKKGRWGSSSWVEFLGVAPTGRDAVYLNANRYQLSRDVALVENSTAFDIPKPSPVVIEENKGYAWNIPGEDPWYERGLISRNKPAEFSRAFNLPGIKDGASEVTVFASALGQNIHHMKVFINTVEVADVEVTGYKDWKITFPVASGILKENNVLTLKLPGNPSTWDVVAFDKLVVDYPSNLLGQRNVPALALAEAVKRNELATGRTDLIVISHPSLMGPVLDEFIAQKISSGWKVKLVDVFDIYQSYGYGMVTPTAIVDYLEDAGKTGFDHVQLVGAASYDYRDFLGIGSVSFIPSIYTNTGSSTKYTPCDTCMVMDDQERPTVAIGRWPVRTQAELESIIRKGRAWENNQVGANQALLIADQNKPGNNFVEQLEQAAQQLLETNDWSEPVRVYLDEAIDIAGDVNAGVAAARTNIRNSLDDGASITIFSGHGAPDTWSFQGMLRQQDVATLNNAQSPTLALPLTCFTTYADSPSIYTLAHQLMAGGDNGAVAVFGAATLSDYNQNGALIREVMDGLLSGNTLGQSIQTGKGKLGESYRDVILNSNLLGDVTLKLQ